MRSFIWSPNPSLVPGGRPGSTYGGLLHATDVYRTFLSWAHIVLPDADGPSGGGTGPVPFDGYDQANALQSRLDNASLRSEVLHAPLYPPLNPAVCADGWGQSCGAALRVGDFKVIVGYPGDSRRLPLPTTERFASLIAATDNTRLGLSPRDRELMNGDGGNDMTIVSTSYLSIRRHMFP